MKDIQIALINFSRMGLKRLIVIFVNRCLKRSGFLENRKKKKIFVDSYNPLGNITKVFIEICNFVHVFSLFQ